MPNLFQFVRRAGPLLWERMQDDRKRDILPAPMTPSVEQWTEEGIHALWIGHSTVLLRVNGFTILTDPVFSERIGIGLGPVVVGMKRLVQPAIGLDAFDKIGAPDLILLSHAHMDHFDLPSLRALENRKTVVVTAVSTSDLLRVRRYGRVQELKWGEGCQVGPAHIRAFEVRHWGARMRTDVHRGYNGYVVEIGDYRILFGGDTAYTDTFRQARSAKPVDLAIMPIGAYDPWIHAHCNPEEAVRMADQAGAELILPVHHQTFQLSNEGYREPIERVLAAAGERVVLRVIGEEFRLGVQDAV